MVGWAVPTIHETAEGRGTGGISLQVIWIGKDLGIPPLFLGLSSQTSKSLELEVLVIGEGHIEAELPHNDETRAIHKAQ